MNSPWPGSTHVQDPKQLRGTGTTEVPKNRAPFEHAVVFMVGGGNYTEYQNLKDYCAVRNILPPSQSVVCICTEAHTAPGLYGQARLHLVLGARRTLPRPQCAGPCSAAYHGWAAIPCELDTWASHTSESPHAMPSADLLALAHGCCCSGPEAARR